MSKLNKILIAFFLVSILIAGFIYATQDFGSPSQDQTHSSSKDEQLISSHFYEINAFTVATGLNTPWVTPDGEEYVIAVTADGEPHNPDSPLEGTNDPSHQLYRVSLSNGSSVPLGRVTLPAKAEKEFDDDTVITHRLLDVLLVSSPKDALPQTLFISFALNLLSEGCRKIVVASFPLDTAKPSNVSSEIQGKTFFETECFPVSTTGDQRLHQSGGRLALVPASLRKEENAVELYLSVGDFVNLAVNSLSLSTTASEQLGSVLHLKQSGFESLAKGLRNPQGLAVVDLGSENLDILTSEHGPRGGDELNLILKGEDYGWPFVGYGTAYAPDDPDSKPEQEGQSSGSTPPLFAWLPSVAPSQILQVKGNEFLEWWSVGGGSGQNTRGDILVSSLAGQSIFRLRIEERVVRYVETIPVGQRIRTFAELPSGKIVIGADSGVIITLSRFTRWSSNEGSFVQDD